jgi:hypothetical protein
MPIERGGGPSPEEMGIKPKSQKGHLDNGIETEEEFERKYFEFKERFAEQLKKELVGKTITCHFLGLGEGWDPVSHPNLHEIWAGKRKDDRPLTPKDVTISDGPNCSVDEVIARYKNFKGDEMVDKDSVYNLAQIPEINDVATHLLEAQIVDKKIKDRLKAEMPRIERYK